MASTADALLPRGLRRALVVLGALVLAGLAPEAAQAASYSVHACSEAGRRVEADGWRTLRLGEGMRADIRCPAASMFGFAETNVARPRGSHFGFRFDAPPDTTIRRYSIDRRVVNTAGNGWAWAHSFFHDEVDYETPGRLRGACWTDEGCTSADGVVAANGEGARSLIFFTDCSYGPPNDCQPGGRAEIEIRSATLALEDAKLPTFTGTPSGSLLDTSRPLSGVRGVSFTAGDKGGGVHLAVLEIDGRPVVREVVDDNGGACTPPFTRIVPCKPTAGATLTFDTARLPDGAHTVRLRVFDATAENDVVHGPIDITTDNVREPGDSGSGGGGGGGEAPAATCVGAPELGVSARLARRTVRYGATASLRGRVTDAAGRPVPGAAVAILGPRGSLGTATSGPTGAYAFRVPAGPSQSLRARVRVEGGFACSALTELRVRAGATLALSRRRARLGQPIRFSGRVRGAVPARGKLVVLQARGPAGRWLVVKNLRTDRAGRYRYTYRFRRAGGRYRFRLQVPREQGFPYALGHSRERRLTVRR